MKDIIQLPKKRFCSACLKLAAGVKSTIPLTHEPWCKKNETKI